MAPKRGVNSLPCAKPLTFGNEAKRPKQGTEEDLLEMVRTAIGQNDKMPDSSKNMLCRMLPRSLGDQASQLRHRYQASVVEMIRDVLAETEAQMNMRVDDAASQIRFCEDNRVACGVRLAEAEAAREARKEGLASAKLAFCEDNLAMQAANQAFQAAVDARTFGEASARDAYDLSAALEASLRENYQALLEGHFTEPTHHLNVLTRLIQRVPLEDSLAKAFPVAASKRPEVRGAFDNAALCQFQAEFAKHARTLRETASNSSAEVAKLRSREAAALEALQQARSRQEASSASLRLVELQHLEAEARVAEVKEKDREYADAALGARADQVVLRRNLEDFQTGALPAFEALHRRASSPPNGCAFQAMVASSELPLPCS